MNLLHDFTEPLLKEAIDRIPARCLDVLYRSSCLAWGDRTGKGVKDGIILVFTPETRNAAFLSQAQAQTNCFSPLNNLLVMYADVQRFGFASVEGLMSDGMYISPPDLTAQMRADYDLVVGLADKHKTLISQCFIEEMTRGFLRRLFNIEEAERAIGLLNLIRECGTANQPVTPRLGELRTTFVPVKANIVEVPTKA